MLPLAVAGLLLTSAINCVPLYEGVTPLHGEKCDFESCTATEPGVLNVHIVPHTHDDVGWLKTVDQYYYGSQNFIQKAGVEYILDSVVRELWEDPKRRFIYVETAFFWKWWTRQSDDIRHKVHALVRQGRLQFVGGAWSMNDEATTHYQSTIDQFTYGLRKLNDTFGRCGLPRVAWQIDPFGHSRELASNLAEMGYKGLFLGRIDYQDKEARLRNKNMEMVWRGDDDLGKSTDIFTGVLYNRYSPPSGFCFDVLCNDEPIVDDPESSMYNVDERVQNFLEIVKRMSESYISNNILLTMGDDFQYQDANMWFKNLDKLIKYTNMKAAKDGLNIKLFYSTPTCYLKAVKDADPILPTKQDDFFPYASDRTAFWTGYFISRPTIKYFERLGNNYLQMAKQLQVLAGLEEHNTFVLDELKSAMGIMQHHDAVTGTEKQHVAADYEKILDQAIEDVLIIPRRAFSTITQRSTVQPPLLHYDRCSFNESSCATSESNNNFVVTIYNPVGWTVKASPIRIPVVNANYIIYGPDGQEVPTQLVELPKEVLNIPTRKSIATDELVFIAKDLPALGFKSYYVKKLSKVEKRSLKRDHDMEKRRYDFYTNLNEYWKNIRSNNYLDIKNVDSESVEDAKIPIRPLMVEGNQLVSAAGEYAQGMMKEIGVESRIEDLEEFMKDHVKSRDRMREEVKSLKFPSLSDEEMRMLSDDPMVVERYLEEYLENERLKIRIDNETGKVTHLILNDGTQFKFNIDFLFYPGCVGNNERPEFRSSGAYIFRPNDTKATEIGKHTAKKTIKGGIVEELQFTQDYVSGVVRVYNDVEINFMELEWLIGPIPIDDDVGKEVIVKYSTILTNNGIFYTDSNGRQMLKRKLNQRPQYNVTLEEPIAGNYYPITNKIYIEDLEKNLRLSVVTDRAQGGGSLAEGEVEVMLHRRLLHDDAFGVGEALNETVNGGTGLVARGKHLLFIEKADDKEAKITEKLKLIETHLHPQVFVSKVSIDLDMWLKLKNVYVGLEQSLPKGVHLLTLEPWGHGKLLLRLENLLEKSDCDTAKEVDLNGLFNKKLSLKSLRETTLSANQWLDDDVSWEWKMENNFYKSFNDAYGSFSNVENATSIPIPRRNVKRLKVELPAKTIRTFIVDYEFVD